MVFSGVPVPLSAAGKGNGELINAAGRRGLHGILQIRVILLAGALLPLQPAAAGTGIVAADLHGLFHGLLFRRGAVAAHVLHGGLGDPLPLDLFVLLQPDGVQPADGLILNGRDHFLKHIQGFPLVDVHGVVVAVALEPDALLQIVHGVDMIHPVFVYHPEHDDTLQLPHDGRA